VKSASVDGLEWRPSLLLVVKYSLTKFYFCDIFHDSMNGLKFCCNFIFLTLASSSIFVSLLQHVLYCFWKIANKANRANMITSGVPGVIYMKNWMKVWLVSG
jgi:hypothetical protein